MYAQISLAVKDLETNKPLAGASVSSLADQEIRISGSDGKVEVSDWKSGTILRISYVGYHTFDHILTDGENRVYLQPDYQILSNLTVVGYENERKLYEIAGSYAINSKLAMARFNDESLVRSMNTLPGIRFEERSPASYRVSIRGNLLRSPYGVRNVKVYWNDIPYTDPSGNTPLNLIDMNNIGRIETIKGPAGSIYGAGIGGAINMYSDATNAKPLTADIGYAIGSFGMQKLIANLNTGNESHRFSIRYASQHADGYRQHTNSDRETVQMSGTFFPSQKRILTAQILYSDLFYQTPGGLNQAQFDENPQQARPGAAAKNASIDHENFLAGIVQDYEWNDKIRNTTSLYFTNGTKENPFINNYELERLKSYGGRTSFDFHSFIGSLPTTFNTGAEMNYGNFHASNHGNVAGHADTLRYEDELRSLQSFVFLQADTDLSDKWILNVGASLNYLHYNIDRLRDVALDTAYQIKRKFQPELMPRIGLVGRLRPSLSVHASVSAGFSPPTSEEVRTSDASINTDLEAEKGVNYEIGVRGNAANGRFYYDATAFWMRQSETIVSKTTDLGTVIFENAGNTSQLGLEAIVGFALIKNASKPISLLKIQTAYTHHDFTFDNYQKESGGENVDYSGNNLTGTAPYISVSTLDLETRGGGYFNFTFNYTDEIPLNDANTAYADSYTLITTKLGWKISVQQKHIFDIFLGVDNLLNEKYSLGNDLNAFGGRYYNAAPERNYFAGIKIAIEQ